MFRPRMRLSGGERNFIWSLVGVSLLSAVLANAIAVRFSSSHPSLINLDPFAVWAFVAGAVGGFCGFLACYRRYFGYEGSRGWMRAAFGGVMISGIGAVICGTLILPYYGTMFAPFQLIIAMIERPTLAVGWVAMLICAHRLMLLWRAERDSIFVLKDPIL